MPFQMEIIDVCAAPAVILTSLQPSNLQFRKLDSEGTSTVNIIDSITNYISHDGSPDCVLSACRIVTSSSSTCGATTSAFFIGSEAGNILSMTISTVALQSLAYYCLECSTNDLPSNIVNSLPFSLEVIAVDCSVYISTSSISGSPFI